jgi:ABC-type lipoprotein release transport system permease subunit
MLTLVLAWRNIWRNRRRTLITMTSIVMAVVLSAVTQSMQRGQYDMMIDISAGQFSGHLQLQADGFLDEPTLDNSMELTDELISIVESEPGVKAVVPRLNSFALAAGYDRSRASMLIGIDINEERHLSDPEEKLVEGRYFTSNSDPSVVISQGLSEFLNVGLGDTLVLLGSGYQGMSANGAYPVVGILKFGLPDLNKALVYMPMETIHDFTGAYGRVTGVAILVENIKYSADIADRLQAKIPEGILALDWTIVMPDLVQAIEADYGSGFIILLVLYMVVGFGILGTVLMMTAERSYELGVMGAIGTPRSRLAGMITLEMFMITSIATLAGIVMSLPLMYYYNINPIMLEGEMVATMHEYGMEPFLQFSVDPLIPVTQAVIVLMISLVIALYPIVHMYRLKSVEAMRR